MQKGQQVSIKYQGQPQMSVPSEENLGLQLEDEKKNICQQLAKENTHLSCDALLFVVLEASYSSWLLSVALVGAIST